MGKKVKALLVAAIALCAIAAVYLYNKDDPGEKLANSKTVLAINEEWWVSKNQSRKSGTQEYKFSSVKAGDVIYDKYGYKLTVQDVYDNEVVLRQEGGLVEANSNGNLNAFAASEDTYTAKKGEALKLRSYSLRSGVLLEIVY